MRLPAFCAGVAMIPAAHFFARRFFDAGVGLLAAALVAVSEPLVGYSTNARGYTILGLAFLVVFIFAARAVDGNRLSDWAHFAAVSAVGLYTVPTMLYGFASIVVWLLFEALLGGHSAARGRLVRNTLLAAFGAVVVAAALYAPIWLRNGFKLVTAMALERMPWRHFVLVLADLFAELWRAWNGGILVAIAWLLAACFFAGILFHGGISRYRVSPAILVLLVPGLLISLERTVPFARVWLYILPVYLATASAGLVALLSFQMISESTRRIVFAGLALAVVAGFGIRVRANSSEELKRSVRLDRICGDLLARLKPGDFVGANGYPAAPAAYYLVAGGASLDRVSADCHLELIRVTRNPAVVPADSPIRLPSAYFIVRSDDAELLHALRAKARPAGVISRLHRLARYGTTTLYEEPDITFSEGSPSGS